MGQKLIVSGASVMAIALSSLMSTAAVANEEDIIVTARLKTESLQEVPLAITAFSAESLERQRITDMRSLSEGTAGLQLDSTGGKQFTSPVIRGMSQVSRSDDENNVPVFIDGVYVSGRDGIDGNLLEVERIEVVKGPQSALYGRSAYSGAINYITKKPTNELTGGMGITYGDHGRMTVKGNISGPLIEDVLFARVSAANDEFDGTYGDTAKDLRIGGYSSKFLSGGLRLVLGNFEAVANAYYADDLVGPAAQIMFDGNCQDRAGRPGMWCGEYPIFENPDFSGFDRRARGMERETLRTSLTLTQQFEGVKVTSITGYNKLKTFSAYDADRQYDGLPYNVQLPDGTVTTANLTNFQTGANDRNYDFSQEFRVESTNDSPLSWLVGGSYYEFESKSDGPVWFDRGELPEGTILLAPAAFYNTGLVYIGDQITYDDGTYRFSKSNKWTKTWAGYGALEYAFSEQLSGRAELRYTSENKAVQQLLNNGPRYDKTFNYWTPRFTLDYTANDDLLFYASVAKGAKAGGFNASAPTAGELAFNPETNWTYEVGMKSSWLDRKLQVNLSLYNVDMDDLQITNQSPNSATSFITQNAGTARSRGFELEVVGRPAQGLTLSASYSLADAKFIDAIDSSLRSHPSFATNQDVSGNPLPRQAKHLANGSIQYEAALSDTVEGYIRLDGRYESKKNGTTAPLLGWVGDRVIANFKAGVTINEGIDLSVWVRNLFNDKTPVLANSALTLGDNGRRPISVLPEYRSMGATLNYKF